MSSNGAEARARHADLKGEIIKAQNLDEDDIPMVTATPISPLELEESRPMLDEEEFEEEFVLAAGSDYKDHFWMPRSLYDWLFPPNVPRSCQLLRLENLAIPCCYLVVGILQGLSGPFINVYPLDLQATEAQQTTVSSIRGLPACFKLLFGFISDNILIGGYRRKPYMFIGWLVASLSALALIMGSNLTVTKDDEGNNVAPDDAPSIPFLSLSLLGFGTGFWLADVMGDSIVAEKAKLEVEKGHLQSTCYAFRFFGLMVASPCSTVLYSWLGPQSVIWLLAVVPLSILPLVLYLREDRLETVTPTAEQCNEIWNTVCSRAVWQPMGFVYLYNVLQIGNAAWKEFLRTGLGFTAIQLNTLMMLGNVLLYFGILAYKYYFIAWSWRSVYISTTLLNGVFSALQVCLITGTTFGISNFWFAFGDETFADFIGGIQFLPTTIMMVHLCPAGSEGASYAMFTTVNNAALTLSSALSTMVLGIWDVSKEAIENEEFGGMIKLTLFTTFIQTAAIAFVGWLPRTKEDLAKLHQGEMGRSRLGGAIFLAVTFFSLFYALVVGFLNIVDPGWAGESR